MPKLTGILMWVLELLIFPTTGKMTMRLIDDWLEAGLVMTPKLKTNLGMRRFMDSAGSGDSYTLTRFYFGNNYDINSEFSLTLSGDFAFKEYVSNSDRTDETNTYELIVNYLPSSDLFFSAGYSYTDNRSHFIQYNAREFLLSANFKYWFLQRDPLMFFPLYLYDEKLLHFSTILPYLLAQLKIIKQY